MKLLTFAWGALYRKYAERLKASCEAAGLELEVVSRKGEPKSREEAWAAKVGAVLDVLKAEEAPVLFLDADALIRRPSELVVAVAQTVGGADFGLVNGAQGPRWGVVYVAPTVQAVDTLEEVAAALAKKRGGIEPIFPKIARKCGAVVAALSPGFCWVEAWGDRQAHGNVRPFIELNV